MTVAEFEILLPAFEKAYLKQYPAEKTKTGNPRIRKAGAGRKSALGSIEQKLLFASVYQKTYPLQAVMGELFVGWDKRKPMNGSIYCCPC